MEQMWVFLNPEFKWKVRIKDHIGMAARLAHSYIENGEK